MKSLNKTLKTFLTVVGLLSFSLLLPNSNLVKSSSTLLQSAEEANCIVNLGFDQDGVLPSSQGLTYSSGPATPESSVFSASSGLLHVDSTGTPDAAWYQLLNAYDPTKDFTLEFRMQVFPGTDLYGIAFEVSDNVSDFEFGFSSSGISLPPTPAGRPFLPFNTTDGFHTYKVFSPGGTASYQLFIDGVLVASNIVSAAGGDPGQRFIFGDGTGGGSGRADIDFVRYCQASSVCVAPPSGMVSWWPGDGDANDIAGSNHGILHNGATFASGFVGQAFSFNGSGSYVEVPDSPSLQLTGALSVDFWVYPTEHVVSGIVTKVDNAEEGAGWGVGYYGTNLPPSVDPQHVVFTNQSFTNASVQSPANSVPFNTWTHIAATSDSTTMRLYINGVQVDSAASPPVLPSTFTTLFGAYQRNGIKEQFFNGLIDEIEIFNRALSASEIQAVYNAGSAGKCKNANGDADGDGVNDAEDNCPTTPNPDQSDFDLDGRGDACDAETGPPKFKDQCKGGGWSRFNVPRAFKNQGDCIQFVNTGK